MQPGLGIARHLGLDLFYDLDASATVFLSYFLDAELTYHRITQNFVGAQVSDPTCKLDNPSEKDDIAIFEVRFNAARLRNIDADIRLVTADRISYTILTRGQSIEVRIGDVLSINSTLLIVHPTTNPSWRLLRPVLDPRYFKAYSYTMTDNDVERQSMRAIVDAYKAVAAASPAAEASEHLSLREKASLFGESICSAPSSDMALTAADQTSKSANGIATESLGAHAVSARDVPTSQVDEIVASAMIYLDDNRFVAQMQAPGRGPTDSEDLASRKQCFPADFPKPRSQSIIAENKEHGMDVEELASTQERYQDAEEKVKQPASESIELYSDETSQEFGQRAVTVQLPQRADKTAQPIVRTPTETKTTMLSYSPDRCLPGALYRTQDAIAGSDAETVVEGYESDDANADNDCRKDALSVDDTVQGDATLAFLGSAESLARQSDASLEGPNGQPSGQRDSHLRCNSPAHARQNPVERAAKRSRRSLAAGNPGRAAIQEFEEPTEKPRPAVVSGLGVVGDRIDSKFLSKRHKRAPTSEPRPASVEDNENTPSKKRRRSPELRSTQDTIELSYDHSHESTGQITRIPTNSKRHTLRFAKAGKNAVASKGKLPAPKTPQTTKATKASTPSITSGRSSRTAYSRTTSILGSALASPPGSSMPNGSRLYIAFASNVTLGYEIGKGKLAALGISEVEDITLCEVYCVKAGGLTKSPRLLLAISSGKTIVTNEWLKQTVAIGQLVHFAPYLANDPSSEKEWGTTLQDAVARYREGCKPLEGCKVLLSTQYQAGLNPETIKQLRNLLQTCGATSMETKRKKKLDDKTILIGTDHKKDIAEAEKLATNLYSKDMISLAVLRGKLDLEHSGYLLRSSNESETETEYKPLKMPKQA